MRKSRVFSMIAALFVSSACADEAPTRPSAVAPALTALAITRGGPLEQFPELAGDLPAANLSTSHPWKAELSDTELVAAVSKADGRVIIGLKPPSAARSSAANVIPAITRAEAAEGRETLRALGVVITRTYRYTSAVAARIDPETAPRLRRLGRVDYIQVDRPGRVLQSTPPQDTSWGLKKVRSHLVWTLFGQATRGEGANVTVLDSGLDGWHSLSAFGDGPAGIATYCYWTVTPTIGSCYDDDIPSGGPKGHGPHVMGVIAARDNAYGFVGSATNLSALNSIRVCDGSGCSPANVMAGIDWAVGSGLPRHIVNISIGYCADYLPMQQVLMQAQNAGILVIAAAGNEVPGAPFAAVCESDLEDNALPSWATSVMFPARYATTMAVSGTRTDDTFAAAVYSSGGTNQTPPPPCGFYGEACTPGGTGGEAQNASCSNGSGSRAGSEVELAAPFGSAAMTSGGMYDQRCGTSFSAAMVSGVAALVWSRNPTWTAAQVRQRLKSTAVPAGPSSQVGAGRVDAYNAVYQTPIAATAAISGPPEMHPNATCGFEATTSLASPQSYAWYVNGNKIKSNASNISYTAGSVPFELSVVVADGAGGTATASKQVNVTITAAACGDQ